MIAMLRAFTKPILFEKDITGADDFFNESDLTVDCIPDEPFASEDFDREAFLKEESRQRTDAENFYNNEIIGLTTGEMIDKIVEYSKNRY